MVRKPASQFIVWGLTATAVLLAVLAWGQSLHWQLGQATTYVWFPLFGLLAFSILWSQYMVLALRRRGALEPTGLDRYFSVTGWMVLAAILLHPGLLAWRLWRDGLGLPPGSELRFVMPGLGWVVILGMINLTILLLFELHRVFAKRPWWRYVTCLVDLVMLSIFYHGLRLGPQTHQGWYHYVWWFYGVTLILALGYLYWQRFKAPPIVLK